MSRIARASKTRRPRVPTIPTETRHAMDCLSAPLPRRKSRVPQTPSRTISSRFATPTSTPRHIMHGHAGADRRLHFVPEIDFPPESRRLTFGRPPHCRLWHGCAALLAGVEAAAETVIWTNVAGHSSRQSDIDSVSERRIRLDPQAVESVARKVVELLEARGVQRRALVDAAELARLFGIERSWVYSHAIELGAVKLGEGAKPRLRFDPEIAARVLRRAGEAPATDPPARPGERADRSPHRGGSRVRLLPIREPVGEDPPPAA
jgi:hypothetical protein